MTTYVVTKARFDDQGEVAQVEWAEANSGGDSPPFIGERHVVDVDRVVEAFDRGDTVEKWFQVGDGWVSSGKLLRKELPDGRETVQAERGGEGRSLQDLPTF